jgi:hypothetical protein
LKAIGSRLAFEPVRRIKLVTHRIKAIIVGLSLVIATGCSSMSPSPAPKQLAQNTTGFRHAAASSASGSACGVELLDFLPIGTWSRTQRAYHSAVSNAGARALLKPTVSDHRIDLMVATIKCASVEGTAVY